MARNENESRWAGLGTFAVRAPGSRDKVGTVAALARCLRGMLKSTGEKALATRKALRVASWLTFITGEKDTMKDINGNAAFIHVGGVNYISTAHAATTMDGYSKEHYGCSIGGGHREGKYKHSWTIRPNGTIEMETLATCGPEYSYSTDKPGVEAFLEAPKVGELKYDLKIDASEVTAALEQISRVISDTELVKSLKEITTEQNESIRKAVQDTIEKESRPGGLLWSESVTNITLQGAQEAPTVKSLDELADEFLIPYLREGTVTDDKIREAYRLANLRLSLRAQSPVLKESGDFICSHNYGKPGKSGWILNKRTGSLSAHDGYGATRYTSNPGL